MDEENLSQFYTHSYLKTFSSIGTEGHLFNFTENTHEKPKSRFYTEWWKIEYFFDTENKVKMSAFATEFNIVLKVIDSGIRQGQEIKGT